MNYYGVRYSKDCHPADLFVTYFTSSKHVAEYIKVHGLPDIVEVRKTFTGDNRVSVALQYEHVVLRRIRAVSRTDFLNRSDNKAIAPECAGHGKTKDTQVHTFTNKDGRTIVATRHEFMNLTGMSASGCSNLINGNSRVSGWSTANSPTDEDIRIRREAALANLRSLVNLPERKASRIKGQNKPELKAARSSSDYLTPYTFVHISGAIERLTRSELLSKYPELDKGAILKVVRGDNKSHKGWSVVR
jgi:hypothetical protein